MLNQNCGMHQISFFLSFFLQSQNYYTTKNIPLKNNKMFPQDVHREVCYASLNIPKRGNQRTKSNRLPNSDFSVYNSVKMHT